jgi:hypothetical protein
MNTEYSNDIISRLPSPISGDGKFEVDIVVPTNDPTPNKFEPNAANPSNSYSYPLMDPAKLIGTGSQPFMNVALPAYITTLYENVFNINTNLENDISVQAEDDRSYPTTWAVQNYVQAAISGTQHINGLTPANAVNIVNTTSSNTVIDSVPPSAVSFNYSFNGVIKTLSLFWMSPTPTPSRDGASKLVMFNMPNHLTELDGSVSRDLVFLYAGDNSYFINLGQQYKYYQFVIFGDFLEFVQSYIAANNGWNFIVKHAMGHFTNTVQVTDGNGAGSLNVLNDSKVPKTGIVLSPGATP